MLNYKQFNAIKKNINSIYTNQKQRYIYTHFKNKTDITKIINNTITNCHNNGGGIIVIPNGEYYSGPIHLKSNVHIHLQDDVIIKFYTDPKKYFNVLTRWEGIDCINYTPLIYAYKQKNIAITGHGILDGQANINNWWSWKNDINGNYLQNKDVKVLMNMMKDNIPIKKRIFGYHHYLRPNFIQFYLCTNILIKNITIINSPMWEIHPVLSNNIHISHVYINSIGPNNDGCNPESCNNVLIEHCSFNTGDDCIAIKSGKNDDGRKNNIPSSNIIIQNCFMYKGHGAVVLGSECSGGINNIFIKNCQTFGKKIQSFLRIKNNAVRGGDIHEIYLQDTKIYFVNSSILNINFVYDEGQHGHYIPKVYNIYINNIRVYMCYRVMDINTFQKSYVDNIFFKNNVFQYIKHPSKINICNPNNIYLYNTKYL
ncbi:glycoside hydrolase family 28 protein [Enterobacteriaceae endosymbiont of Macroplea appendiculata]|uniref:glycoside hydrolase family 28 protein n=1 Tax=Enterobacteriaceae endosymbiont of Macroplea appendiculata TaxID=2675790 RepID=UPI0014493AB9|nr:glycoside hydrolase family 28 protein [Enterobacteriaceae endosymbiont of Macroplea appendiculata]QJC30826.1 glycoside hydrolase family 28 protein [Enterobacteriaceae endosymbiont of Macroplea appendiculata]